MTAFTIQSLSETYPNGIQIWRDEYSNLSTIGIEKYLPMVLSDPFVQGRAVRVVSIVPLKGLEPDWEAYKGVL